MLSPPDTLSQPRSARTSTGRIPGRWLTLARSAWMVCALLLLPNLVIYIPAYYQLMLIVCTLPYPKPCTIPGQPNQPSGQLTPGNVQALAHLHLSVATYATYFVTCAVVVVLLFWGVGLLIFWRKSDEWMGLFVSLLFVLSGSIGGGVFLLTYLPAQVSQFLQIPLYLLIAVKWTAWVAFFLTFPTGRFAPRWSWLVIALNFLLYGPTDWYPVGLWVAGLVVSFGSALAIMIYRYVRVFDAVQRQQTKWVVYTTALSISLAVISAAIPAVVSANSPYQLLSVTLTFVYYDLIPLGLGIAILRYRLWDIDLIINRTLVYGSLTALLALVYVGFVIGLESLMRLFTGQGSQSPIIIVASTLAIAALFRPLRHRIQRIIDRRFYRRKYDAAKTVAAFSATLRNEVDLNQLSEQLVAVVEETMQPTFVSLWLRPPAHDGTQRAPWRASPPVSSEGT